MTEQQDYTAFAHAYLQNERHFERSLEDNGWLHAWKPDQHPKVGRRRGYHFSILRDRDNRLHGEEKNEFIKFAADRLYAADPSDDKRHFSALTRWFCYGLDYDDLDKTTSVLKKYEVIFSADPDLRSDPFRLYNEAGHPGLKRRPVKKNPAEAARSFYDLERFIEIYVMRQERAQSFDPDGPPKDVDPKDILHACPDFYLYKSTSTLGDKALTLELPNGARYSLQPEWIAEGRFFRAEDEYPHTCMPERMVRDIPGLAVVLAPLFEEYFQQDHYDQFFSFAFLLRCAGQPSPFEEGSIAEAFRHKYEKKLSRYEELKNEGLDDQEPQRHTRFGREQKNPHAAMFFSLFDDLATLAHFPGESERVDKDLTPRVLLTSIEAEAMGSARRALHIVNKTAEWRENVTPEHISPIFNELANRAQTRHRDYDDQKYLTRLMAFIATTPHWRDGSEAEHLPVAIDYILKNKDWPNLKVILLCATHLNDPVSQMWREAIPRELRDKIEENRFDNSYKYHHIDLLMQRMNDLDAGHTRMYRLREMPNTQDGRDAVEREIARKRTLRAARPEAEINTLAM